MVKTTGSRGLHLWWWGLAALPLGFLGLFFLWPLAAVMVRGLTDGGALDLAGMAAVLAEPRTLETVRTTLLLASVGTLGSVTLGVPAAYALYRLRWRGQTVVRALVTVPFVLPTIVVATAFSALLGRSGPLGFMRLDQSVWAIVAALVFYNVSVVVRVVGGAWQALDGRPADAARTLGASRLRAWAEITLPALWPAVGSAAAVAFLFCATSFGVVLVLGGTRVRTVETEIYLQVNQFLDLRAASVLALVQLLFVALALGAAAWARGRMDRTTRGADGTRPALRSDVPVVALALFPALILLAAPLTALVERSLRTPSGHGLDHYVALFNPPQRAVLAVPVWEAAVNSLVTAAIAATIASALGVLVTYLVTHRSRQSAMLDAVVVLPLGVSAVMVGLGMLLTLNRNVVGVDLRGSWWLVAVAQAVIALPLVVRTLVPVARGLGQQLRTSAATLGANRWRTWTLVEWPLLRAPVGAAVALGAAIALGEFGATSFLARPDRPTLPTAIFRLLGRPGAENVGMAFAAAVVLAALTMAVMMSTERLRARAGAEL